MLSLRTGQFFYLYLSYFLVALLVCFSVTPLMRTLSFRLGAVDKGGGRRAHQGVIPRLGGGGILLAFMPPLAFALTRGEWKEETHQVLGILSAGSLVFLVGAWDDLRRAPLWLKLTVEVLASLLIVSWGVRINVVSNPFGEGYLRLGWLGVPATVVWIVVITNAVNLVDGLDGLASTTGILIALTLFAAAPPESYHLRIALVVLAGSLAGFLRHNFPPATIFMGDSGSLFVGFVLASLSIVSSAKAAAATSLLIPAVAFFHPLADMTYAVLRRYSRGLPLGRADREHIHHKLLEMGLSRKRALLLLAAFNAVVMVSALLYIGRSVHSDLMVLIVLAVLLVLGLRLFNYVKLRGSSAEQFRLLAQGRDRRYLVYMVSRFLYEAREARDGEGLRKAAEGLLAEFGCAFAATVLTDGAGGERRYEAGAEPPGGEGTTIEFTLAIPGGGSAAVRLRAPEGDPPPFAIEVGKAIARGTWEYHRSPVKGL